MNPRVAPRDRDVFLVMGGRVLKGHAAGSSLRPHDLLRVGVTTLELTSECSFTTRKLRFLSHFRLVPL